VSYSPEDHNIFSAMTTSNGWLLFIEFQTSQSDMKLTVFWAVGRVVLQRRSQHFVGMCCLYLQGGLSSTLKLELACSSEKSVTIRQTAQRHVPEARNVYRLLNFCTFPLPLPPGSSFLLAADRASVLFFSFIF
jgi:hypothetical protein